MIKTLRNTLCKTNTNLPFHSAIHPWVQLPLFSHIRGVQITGILPETQGMSARKKDYLDCHFIYRCWTKNIPHRLGHGNTWSPAGRATLGG